MRYFLTLAILLAGCAATSGNQTSNEVEKIEVPVIKAGEGRQKLIDLAINSKCATTAHDVQGTPPKSFLRGIAFTYVHNLCNKQTGYYKLAAQPLGDPSKDALAYYGLNPKDESERFDMVYSLMVGSAARESSWRWCVGKDPGASNTSSETCEAGLYQTSWNSRSASPVLRALFDQYSEYAFPCFAEAFKGTTTCSASNLKNWGVGEGVKFQELSKSCPGFATEYHAVMVRIARKHYGPINRKKSEIKPACTDMFKSIRKAVEADPNLCYVL